MVKNSFLRGCVLVGTAFALHVGCDGKTIGTSGGETNWLEGCDADDDCGSAGKCLCGVCSAECTDDASCSGAHCATSGSNAFAAACSTSLAAPGLCLATCDASHSCNGDFTCFDGVCVRPPLRDASAGNGGKGGTGGATPQGTGGKSGSGGSSGTGGATSPIDGGPDAKCANGACSACTGDGGQTVTSDVPATCTDDPSDPTCQEFIGCIAPNTAANDDSVTVSYHAQCPEGRVAHWDQFTYAIDVAPGAAVNISGKFHKDGDAGAPIVNESFATFDHDAGNDTACTSGCAFDLTAELMSADDWPSVDLTFEFSGARGSLGVKRYELRYSCLEPFDGTCDWGGQTWANGASGLGPNRCDPKECRNGKLLDLVSSNCIAPACGCDDKFYGGACASNDGGISIPDIGPCPQCWDGQITKLDLGECVCMDGNPKALCTVAAAMP